jgi:NADPH:quinone reductase
MKAIRFETTGGPEVLKFVEQDLQKPGAGEVRLRHTAIGLNFIDTYHRSGLYPVPLPSGLGLEAAGVVEELGANVKGFKVGDRVAYGTGALGAYSEARNYPANRLIKLPKSISDSTAAGMMLKGMTARYLLRATYKVKRGETILLHAAAGGVGMILAQWAKALGVKVIGVVGSADKVALAKSVPVVYDGVGQATLMDSLDSLSPRGMLVSFGNASGPVKAFDLGMLASRGSLFVTRPTLMAYTATDKDFAETAQDLVEIVKSGKVLIDVHQRYALGDARAAHEDLQARRTTGATVLIP